MHIAKPLACLPAVRVNRSLRVRLCVLRVPSEISGISVFSVVDSLRLQVVDRAELIGDVASEVLGIGFLAGDALDQTPRA